MRDAKRRACPLQDAKSKWIFTTDQGKRGGKILHLKSIVDKAVIGADCVEKVLMFTVTGTKVLHHPRRRYIIALLYTTDVLIQKTCNRSKALIRSPSFDTRCPSLHFRSDGLEEKKQEDFVHVVTRVVS